jgi:putative ATP-binding cassette transporter
MRGLRRFFSDLWYLAIPYFRSEQRWSARLLLAIIIGLGFVAVGLSVLLNLWNGAFFNAIQSKDQAGFLDLLLTYQKVDEGGFFGIIPGFAVLAFLLISLGLTRQYLRRWLEIRWRAWLTGRYQADWLTDRAYYRIQLAGDAEGVGTDNPDQRISDDVRDFIENTLVLGLDFIRTVASLFSFLSILWVLSGSATLLGVTVPGYMVWVAIIYAVAGTGLTQLVGHPLVWLNFKQQRVEADYRFALIRLRENAEGVALYNGEKDESQTLRTRFSAIVQNWYQIMNRQLALNLLTIGYDQAANVFPLIVASPRYFAGKITFGQLTRISGAFGTVQGSLSWFVNNYEGLAQWSATVNRLATFRRAIEAAHLAHGGGIQRVPAPDGDLALHDLHLTLPDGTSLIERVTLNLPQHGRTAVQGRSGSGKSTLFRAMAGIWPFGTGSVGVPPGRTLFLPQKPYIPLGSLRRAVTYPADIDAYPQIEIEQALADAGLGSLAPLLDVEEPWAQRLSGGEQQRLALARALLTKPDWLFLDEATASLDEEAEMEVYATLRQRLPETAIVSITHRPEVAALHDNRISIEGSAGQGRRLVAAAPS